MEIILKWPQAWRVGNGRGFSGKTGRCPRLSLMSSLRVGRVVCLGSASTEPSRERPGRRPPTRFMKVSKQVIVCFLRGNEDLGETPYAIILEICRAHASAVEYGPNITPQWLPGHCGLSGNQQVNTAVRSQQRVRERIYIPLA